jgi:hypothetical protein
MTPAKPRTYALVTLLLVAGLLALPLARVVAADPGGGYTVSWHTVDGGGGTSTGGPYTLDGSIGQPDAGRQSGGAYTLAGGFWAGLAAAVYNLFLPLVVR